MSLTEILADLAADSDLAGTIANLEATYFGELELLPNLDPITCYRLGRARDALAVAADAVKRLSECRNYLSEDPNGMPSANKQ